jgi:hypothetical protein
MTWRFHARSTGREREEGPMFWWGATFSPLEAALALAGNGIPVCPFHHPEADGSGWVTSIACSCGRPGCLQPCNHPLPPTGLEAATTDPDWIRYWWRDHPDANVGLVTGVACDVIDADPETGSRAFRSLARGSGGLGPVARTGTGRWLFFAAPSGRRGGVLGDDGHARLGPQVRWRGLDGFVLAPPSRTLLGNAARWAQPLATGLPDPHELAEAVTGALDEQDGRMSWLAGPVRRVRGRVALS